MINLGIDRRTGSRVSFRNALVEQFLILALDVIWQTLSAAIGASQIRLIPVVRIMDVFQPATDEDRQ